MGGICGRLCLDWTQQSPDGVRADRHNWTSRQVFEAGQAPPRVHITSQRADAEAVAPLRQHPRPPQAGDAGPTEPAAFPRAGGELIDVWIDVGPRSITVNFRSSHQQGLAYGNDAGRPGPGWP
jgi:hypothetical protein